MESYLSEIYLHICVFCICTISSFILVFAIAIVDGGKTAIYVCICSCVIVCQNIIMHYKYLNIIVKQFTHFCRIFGSVDLRY